MYYPEGAFHYNHGKGKSFKRTSPTYTSSWAPKFSRKKNDVYGANLAFYDGSMRWVGGSELVHVGWQALAAQSGSSQMLSLMPGGSKPPYVSSNFP